MAARASVRGADLTDEVVAEGSPRQLTEARRQAERPVLLRLQAVEFLVSELDGARPIAVDGRWGCCGWPSSTNRPSSRLCVYGSRSGNTLVSTRACAGTAKTATPTRSGPSGVCRNMP